MTIYAQMRAHLTKVCRIGRPISLYPILDRSRRHAADVRSLPPAKAAARYRLI